MGLEGKVNNEGPGGIRRPKPEIRKKAAIRTRRKPRDSSDFDLRISFDPRISDFGFRQQLTFATGP